jgi:hypothetical protein
VNAVAHVENTTAPVVLDAAAARRLTARIRDALAVADGLLLQAWTGRAWEALGHASWADYIANELPQLRFVKVDRADRVARHVTLAEAGMTVRAISDAYGVGVGTVHRDIAGAARPETVTATDGRVRAARVERPATPPAPAESRADVVVRLVAAAGPAGLTCRELERKLRVHHGIASGALSRVARQGRVARIGSRDGWGIYVAVPMGTS